MRTFFLDLASHAGAIALVDGTDLKIWHDADRRIADHELLPLMEKTLHTAGWQWSDLERMACVTGPGGFMSLRVACSLANAIAWDRALPLAGLHLSDLHEARLTSKDAQCFWLHSTKREELFARGFNVALWPEAVHVRLPELLTTLPKASNVIGELIPEHRALLEAHGCSFPDIRDTRDVLPAFLEVQTYGKEPVMPWYGREG